MEIRSLLAWSLIASLWRSTRHRFKEAAAFITGKTDLLRIGLLSPCWWPRISELATANLGVYKEYIRRSSWAPRPYLFLRSHSSEPSDPYLWSIRLSHAIFLRSIIQWLASSLPWPNYFARLQNPSASCNILPSHFTVTLSKNGIFTLVRQMSYKVMPKSYLRRFRLKSDFQCSTIAWL